MGVKFLRLSVVEAFATLGKLACEGVFVDAYLSHDAKIDVGSPVQTVSLIPDITWPCPALFLTPTPLFAVVRQHPTIIRILWLERLLLCILPLLP